MLRAPSPQALKKYGLYAILSFFISLSAVLGLDDLKVRETDVQYERTQNEKLRTILHEQYMLKLEQERLLKITDTLNQKTNEGH